MSNKKMLEYTAVKVAAPHAQVLLCPWAQCGQVPVSAGLPFFVLT